MNETGKVDGSPIVTRSETAKMLEAAEASLAPRYNTVPYESAIGPLRNPEVSVRSRGVGRASWRGARPH